MLVKMMHVTLKKKKLFQLCSQLNNCIIYRSGWERGGFNIINQLVRDRGRCTEEGLISTILIVIWHQGILAEWQSSLSAIHNICLRENVAFVDTERVKGITDILSSSVHILVLWNKCHQWLKTQQTLNLVIMFPCNIMVPTKPFTKVRPLILHLILSQTVNFFHNFHDQWQPCCHKYDQNVFSIAVFYPSYVYDTLKNNTSGHYC